MMLNKIYISLFNSFYRFTECLSFLSFANSDFFISKKTISLISLFEVLLYYLSKKYLFKSVLINQYIDFLVILILFLFNFFFYHIRESKIISGTTISKKIRTIIDISIVIIIAVGLFFLY